MRWTSHIKVLNKDDSAAEANQTAQTNFYNTLTSNYSADYGQFEGAIDNMQSKLDPILNAGPGQYGFDATEDAAIRGAAINNDAASAQNAEVATNQQITAQNGGAPVMPTGAEDELRQQGDVAAAQKLSSDQNTITQAGYQAGQQNYDTALSAETSDLGLMNPNSFAGAATSSGNAATGAVNATVNAQQADNSWMTLVGGALGGAGSALQGSKLMTG